MAKMSKYVQRCKEEGVVCKKMQPATKELEIALNKMLEEHKKAHEYYYGYLLAFAWDDDIAECAYELKAKIEQLETEQTNICCKCKGWNSYIDKMLIEAEMFVARHAFAVAEVRYEECVGPEKYLEMFYE